MSERPLLPLVAAGNRPRRDAARNEEKLLAAAADLVGRCGADHVTMDAVATAAGVGKGTVFRRFGSREGLMAALLDRSEREWQAGVLFGPPPLGPGAPPLDRLIACGRSRIRMSVQHIDLMRAAGVRGRASGPFSFVATHLRYLMTQLGVPGDVPLLVVALLAPLDVAVLDQVVNGDGASVERVADAWEDVARRIAAGPAPEAPRPPAS